MSLEYYYAVNRLVGQNGVRDTRADANPANRPKDHSISPIVESTNPLFNFSADFLTKMQSISSNDLAQAVPYIALSSVDSHGNVIQNFNLSFFTKPINYDVLASAQRNADRPEMSLVDVSISSDLATGTIYFQNVSLTVKLHKPNDRTSTALASILFPGSTLKLSYGWNITSTGNQFLASKDTFFFSVRDYTIEFDISGQAELVVEGIALSDIMNNILAGDIGQSVGSDDAVTEEQVGGIKAQANRQQTLVNHLQQQQITNTGAKSLSVKHKMGKNFQPTARRATNSIKQQFNTLMDNLSALRRNDHRVRGAYVTVHDIIKTLFSPSFDQMHGPFVPTNARFRFVYGAFNASLHNYANTSIADFPIHWKTFKQKITDSQNNAATIPSLRSIIEVIIEQFLTNEPYWRNNLLQNQTGANIPLASLNTTTHTVGQDIICQMMLVDERKDIPITQQVLYDLHRETATDDEIEQAVKDRGGNLPTIRIGHCNAFVKTINLSHVNDETMRTVFINRILQDTTISPRVPVPNSKLVASQKDHPFILPLEGEMEVVGHIEWRPMRFFYLRTGIYLLDGVYKITRVEHRLDAGGFTTDISFTYH